MTLISFKGDFQFKTGRISTHTHTRMHTCMRMYIIVQYQACTGYNIFVVFITTTYLLVVEEDHELLHPVASTSQVQWLQGTATNTTPYLVVSVPPPPHNAALLIS